MMTKRKTRKKGEEKKIRVEGKERRKRLIQSRMEERGEKEDKRGRKEREEGNISRMAERKEERR